MKNLNLFKIGLDTEYEVNKLKETLEAIDEEGVSGYYSFDAKPVEVKTAGQNKEIYVFISTYLEAAKFKNILSDCDINPTVLEYKHK